MNEEYKREFTIVEEDKSIEKYIEDNSLMNDIRFRSTLDNNIELASFILNIVLRKKDLVVDKIKTQESLDLVDNRSVILDAHAIDSNNVHYNIEMQKTKTLDIIYRSRFHLSIMDTNNLNKGNKFSKLPETYVIFFCNFDLYKKNKSIYRVERYVDKKHLFNDKEHIIFINCTYKNIKNDIGKLIHDMKSKIGEKKCYNIFEKNDLGAIEKMGQVSEKIVRDTLNDVIVKMIEKGFSIEDISEITKKSTREIRLIKTKHKL